MRRFFHVINFRFLFRSIFRFRYSVDVLTHMLVSDFKKRVTRVLLAFTFKAGRFFSISDLVVRMSFNGMIRVITRFQLWCVVYRRNVRRKATRFDSMITRCRRVMFCVLSCFRHSFFFRDQPRLVGCFLHFNPVNECESVGYLVFNVTRTRSRRFYNSKVNSYYFHIWARGFFYGWILWWFESFLFYVGRLVIMFWVVWAYWVQVFLAFHPSINGFYGRVTLEKEQEDKQFTVQDQFARGKRLSQAIQRISLPNTSFQYTISSLRVISNHVNMYSNRNKFLISIRGTISRNARLRLFGGLPWFLFV